MDLGGSLPLKPISIMDLGHCIQMNPLNTFLWPLEASRRPKTGLKVANFHGFETCTLSGKAFFGWTRQHPVADFLTLEIVISRDRRSSAPIRQMRFCWMLLLKYPRASSSFYNYSRVVGKDPPWSTQKSSPRRCAGFKTMKIANLRPVLGLLEVSRGHKKAF